jgi:hypothetical protein
MLQVCFRWQTLFAKFDEEKNLKTGKLCASTNSEQAGIGIV